MKTYTIEDESKVPQELLDAVEQGKDIECGFEGIWVVIDEPEFRCSCTYRIKEE